MGARRALRLLAAIMLLGFGFCGACGDRGEPASNGTVSEKTQPSPGTAPVSLDPDLSGAHASLATRLLEESGDAFEALADPDRGSRRDAVRRLTQAGWAIDTIARHALHVVQRGVDVGLLADLLADHPTETLPYLLHRVTHAAVLQVGQICRALGRRRASVTGALAVLLVRALLDPGEIVRTEARLALWNLDPGAVEIVDAHFRAFPVSEDGSVLHLSATLLLGPGSVRDDTPFRRALGLALDADAARFSDETGRAVAAYKKQLAGRVPTWLQPGSALRGWGAEEIRAAEYLAGAQGYLLGSLDDLLDRPGYVLHALLAYGLLGQRMNTHAPKVLEAWRRHVEANRDLLSNLDEPDLPHSVRRQREEAWDDPAGRRLGGAAAWVLVRMGNDSTEVTEELWRMLQGKLSPYDRRMAEVTLQALRPRDVVLWSMFEAAAPPFRPADSRAARGSAQAVLPFSIDHERPRLRNAIDQLLQSRTWPRLQRVKLTSLRRGLEATPMEMEERAEALVGQLRRHVLAIDSD